MEETDVSLEHCNNTHVVKPMITFVWSILAQTIRPKWSMKLLINKALALQFNFKSIMILVGARSPHYFNTSLDLSFLAYWDVSVPQVGAVVEVKNQDGVYQEATINKLTDASIYTVGKSMTNCLSDCLFFFLTQSHFQQVAYNKTCLCTIDSSKGFQGLCFHSPKHYI